MSLIFPCACDKRDSSLHQWSTKVLTVPRINSTDDDDELVIWGFPEMGIPLNPPFLFGIFNEINHPAIFRYPHDYGNHHDYGPIFAQVKSHLRGRGRGTFPVLSLRGSLQYQ
jgi:hypothetical protein